MKIFHKFSNNDLRVAITWKTRNIRSLFLLKDKNHYKSCVIYQEDTQLLHSHLGGWSRVHQVQNVCEQGEGVSHQWDRLYINFFTRYFVTFIKIKKMFFKLGLHKNLAILTKKHLRWSLFRHRCSPVKFVKFLRTVIFVEHLRYLSCLTYLFLNN